MPTKYDVIKGLIEKETFWSGGSDHPWKGDALTTPWFLDRLAMLAAQAPAPLIADLIDACEKNAEPAPSN